MLKTTVICVFKNPDGLLTISNNILYFEVFHYGCYAALVHANASFWNAFDPDMD
jgi:hypothetical protein